MNRGYTSKGAPIATVPTATLAHRIHSDSLAHQLLSHAPATECVWIACWQSLQPMLPCQHQCHSARALWPTHIVRLIYRRRVELDAPRSIALLIIYAVQSLLSRQIKQTLYNDWKVGTWRCTFQCCSRPFSFRSILQWCEYFAMQSRLYNPCAKCSIFSIGYH